jgi:hypothetical protein
MPYRGSFGLVLTLHVLSAVFVVGPLGVATVVAPWLLRRPRLADNAERRVVAAGLTGTTWSVRLLSAASVVVAALGFVILHKGSFGSVRTLSDPWILYSVVLWAVAIIINLGPLDRLLARARSAVDAGRDPRALVMPLAVAGVVSSACWICVVALMVVKPGA